MKIAFIGLGNMGGPMARNLLKAGHALTVFDVVQRNVDAMVALGAVAAGSAKHAAAEGELVITMLPSSPHVKSVYLGEDGVLAGARSGIPLIDSSTIDPHSAREVAAAAHTHGNPMADAPVSGGTGGAEAGTLTFMVGADPALFEFIRPILAQMGKNIVHCGGTGTGQVAKICNNMLLGISMIGVAEAMNLGASLGIEPKILAGIINTSSGRCWSSDTYNPYPGVTDNAPAARGYTGGFGTDLMLKDLGLATDAAKQAKQSVAMGAMAQQLYQLWSAQGAGGQDFSSIINLLKKPS
ncbi:MAG: 3-hydroxyisobutyrate dehydrogenase [Paraburkholderia sp.]|uniref:3-hydroxyisobutyrate dehydrogenase n=1 Tax=Paraburkholderia sp. TaxID=1926495 RepID=UPI003C33677B